MTKDHKTREQIFTELLIVFGFDKRQIADILVCYRRSLFLYAKELWGVSLDGKKRDEARFY